MDQLTKNFIFYNDQSLEIWLNFSTGSWGDRTLLLQNRVKRH